MKRSKYGYLGPQGTFSEMAVRKYCKREDETIPFDTIREIVKNVKNNEISSGIIPLENSLEGSVNLSMDLLFKESDIKIIAEVILPIEHYLLSPPGVRIKDIEEIFSHRQAIAQSGDYIYSHLPEVKITYTESTAAAAEFVVGSKKKAMIGSRRISELYNLDILAENVEGDLENYTRFVVIGDLKKESGEFKEEIIESYDYKTSIICTPDVNRPGVLHEMLGEFANRGIDLTRIESRPTKKRLGEYLFFIDLEGHRKQPKLAKALDEVRKKSGLFKILGSYEQGNIRKKIR